MVQTLLGFMWSCAFIAFGNDHTFAFWECAVKEMSLGHMPFSRHQAMTAGISNDTHPPEQIEALRAGSRYRW